MGYSVGHWQGDTLVVDTVGLNDRAYIAAQNWRDVKESDQCSIPNSHPRELELLRVARCREKLQPASRPLPRMRIENWELGNWSDSRHVPDNMSGCISV